MSIYFYFYEDELLYIGSTFGMKDRIKKHQYKYDSDILPFYRDLKANGLTMDDLELEEVKTGIVDDKELRLLEGECQRFYKPQCNINIAGRSRKESHKEYYENNKVKILARHKEYNEKNRGKVLAQKIVYSKKWREKRKLEKL